MKAVVATDFNICRHSWYPFHPPITLTFPKCDFGKNVWNHRVSTLGLVRRNGSIIYSKCKMPCFAMSALQQLWHRIRCIQVTVILHNISRGFNYWEDSIIRFVSLDAFSFYQEASYHQNTLAVYWYQKDVVKATFGY